MRSTAFVFSLVSAGTARSLISAFSVRPAPARPTTRLLADTIVSPFDNGADEDGGGDPVATLPDMGEKGPLELTWDNVEMVLDDMRPYLIQDGGNVAITDIDGPVVLLELQGACGTCPSSTVRGAALRQSEKDCSTSKRFRNCMRSKNSMAIKCVLTVFVL